MERSPSPGLVAEYEHETGKKLEDDLKVVVVIMP